MMTRVLFGALVLAATITAQANTCIQINEPDIDFADNSIGAAKLHWRAELKNQCRKTYDADLTIQLLNGRDETIYAFVEKTTLGVEERLDISRDVYIPSRIVDQVNDFSIQLEERERQY